ncbi:GNAT family N-acetyltransferase [Hahella aquimaris]|uniref:GNAT family N-acetyltransferase n=1 Tax=Hahella sp. HNIBRBA332 TaxID=3015983 RepID=UPI00273B8866|nr:GNAT family N-acetyltransferase [Hahella sp. HNIBRBA332]WLQ14452.1 GNAT family N-acetyltransferase [Hahella sp. HNIBRBA332]
MTQPAQTIRFENATKQDSHTLAEIRTQAMKPSLEAVGRFDENRVRSRFLDTFVPEETFKIMENGELAGFFVLRNKQDHLYLDHLYIRPDFQNRSIGGKVLAEVKREAANKGLPVKLCALRDSKANDFYQKHGFVKTHEGEFDIYYEFSQR